MLRWYDYVAAVVAADIMLSCFLYAMTADVWYMSLIGSMAVLAACFVRQSLPMEMLKSNVTHS
jgi:hypothetical protein